MANEHFVHGQGHRELTEHGFFLKFSSKFFIICFGISSLQQKCVFDFLVKFLSILHEKKFRELTFALRIIYESKNLKKKLISLGMNATLCQQVKLKYIYFKSTSGGSHIRPFILSLPYFSQTTY